MATHIGPFNVRRSGWINASPERVWQEFESFERMAAWYGTGHMLTRYEPWVGGWVETDATNHQCRDTPLVFSGAVVAFDPPREVTFEQDWVGHGWRQPPLVTFRLTPQDGGTIVELFHHGFNAASASPGEELNGFEAGWDNHHLIRLQIWSKAHLPLFDPDSLQSARRSPIARPVPVARWRRNPYFVRWTPRM